jgi:hypothetical protein
MTENVLQPVDLDVLETHLETLMKCYRDSLRFVEVLPGFGRVRVEYPDDKSPKRKGIAQALYRVTNPGHRFVVRSLVRLFVEAHIRTRLETLVRLLRIEASASIKDSESNARAKKLKALIAPLDDLQKALFSWKQRGALFARFPLLPVLIALATPFLAGYTGINFSGAKSIGESIMTKAQSGGLTRSLAVAAILLGELYMLLAPALTSLGFRIKRAILAGGKSVWRLFDEPEHIRWVSFPTTNAYQIENKVFEVIAVPKPKEFPLDFVMGFLPFYVLIIAVLFSAGFISQLVGGERLTLVDALMVGAPWVTLLGYAYHGRKNFLSRRDQGEM